MSTRASASLFTFASLLFALPAAAQQVARSTASLPRFVFVAATTAPRITDGPDGKTVRIARSLHVAPGAIHAENPLGHDFFTVDTREIAKGLVEDPSHPGTFSHDGPIPPRAIMGYSQQGMGETFDGGARVSYPRWFTALNVNGYHPQTVRFKGAATHGVYDTERAGIAGPKLVLIGTAGYVHALPTEQDELTVYVDGSADQDFSSRDERDVRTSMSATTLAAAIRAELARRALPRNLPIRLVACDSGALQPGSPWSSGQRLADALVTEDNPEGNVVHAATGLAYNEARTIEHEGVGDDEIFVFPTTVTQQTSYVTAESARGGLGGERYRTYRGRTNRLRARAASGAARPVDVAARAGTPLAAQRLMAASAARTQVDGVNRNPFAGRSLLRMPARAADGVNRNPFAGRSLMRMPGGGGVNRNPFAHR